MKIFAAFLLMAFACGLGRLNAQNSTPQDKLDTASILKELSRDPIKPKISKEHRDYLKAKSKNEVSKEIIAELRKHKEYIEWTGPDIDLAFAACFLFSSLDLPESDVIAELDKEGTPFEKVELMELLRGRTDPAAIEALLKQLSDKRIYKDGFGEHSRLYRRVCDWAILILSFNLTGKYPLTSEVWPDSKREKVIEETLQKLNLKVPEGDKKK